MQDRKCFLSAEHAEKKYAEKRRDLKLVASAASLCVFSQRALRLDFCDSMQNQFIKTQVLL